jgi:hypothetical protein
MGMCLGKEYGLSDIADFSVDLFFEKKRQPGWKSRLL